MSNILTLYGRKNCCLCEGLRIKLQKIQFSLLRPTLKLEIIDIDCDELSDSEKKSFDLEVPVMVLRSDELTKTFKLPRVSPRINEQALFAFLQKSLNSFMGMIK